MDKLHFLLCYSDPGGSMPETRLVQQRLRPEAPQPDTGLDTNVPIRWATQQLPPGNGGGHSEAGGIRRSALLPVRGWNQATSDF